MTAIGGGIISVHLRDFFITVRGSLSRHGGVITSPGKVFEEILIGELGLIVLSIKFFIFLFLGKSLL